MAYRSQGEDIRIVGDFVCEAIPDSSMSAEKPSSRGCSEGVHVIGDFVVDAVRVDANVEEGKQTKQ